jgi:uncharacterized protein YndB with AHSA1/START domain
MTAAGRSLHSQRMLLRQFNGQASIHIDASPTLVFATVTDVHRLPEWNNRIPEVLEEPDGPLAEGTEWKVQMHVPPAKWVSHARVLRYDPVQLTFQHRSDSDDGNPSYAIWTWTVTPADAGAVVNVTWDIHPETFWRRFLFAKLRRRQLVDEVSTSLHALAYHLAAHEPA